MSERRRVSPRGIKPATKPPTDKTQSDKEQSNSGPPRPNRRERRQQEFATKKEEKKKLTSIVSRNTHRSSSFDAPAFNLSSLPSLVLTNDIFSHLLPSQPDFQTTVPPPITDIVQECVLEPGSPGHFGSISSLSWHPDGLFLASGDDAGVLKVWDCTTNTLVWSKNIFSEVVESIVLSRSLVTACSSESDDVCVFDLKTGHALNTVSLDEFADAIKHTFTTENDDLYWVYTFSHSPGKVSVVNVQTSASTTFVISDLRPHEHIIDFDILSTSPLVLVCVVSSTPGPIFSAPRRESVYTVTNRLLFLNAGTGEIITSFVLPGCDDIKLLIDHNHSYILLYYRFFSQFSYDIDFSISLYQYNSQTGQFSVLQTLHSEDISGLEFLSEINRLVWIREGERALLYDVEGYSIEILIKSGPLIGALVRTDLSDLVSLSPQVVNKRSEDFYWSICSFSATGDGCALGNDDGGVIISINTIIHTFSSGNNYDSGLYSSTFDLAPLNESCVSIKDHEKGEITIYTIGPPVQMSTYHLTGLNKQTEHGITNVFWGINDCILVVLENCIQVYTFQNTTLTLRYTSPLLTSYRITSAILSLQKTFLILSIKKRGYDSQYPSILILRLTEPELTLEQLDLSKALPGDAGLASFGSTYKHLFFIQYSGLLFGLEAGGTATGIDYPLEPSDEKTVIPFHNANKMVISSWGYETQKASPLLAIISRGQAEILLFSLKEKVWRSIPLMVQPAVISFIPQTSLLVVITTDNSLSLFNCETGIEVFKKENIVDSETNQIKHSLDKRYFYTAGPNNSLVRWKYMC